MLIVSGRRLRRAGQLDRAVQAIKKAIDIDPNRGAFYAELGQTYMAMPNGAAAAVQQLGQAVSRAPNNVGLVVMLGEAYKHGGDLEHARQQWEAALNIDHDNADAHLGLARYYAQKGDAARARKEYELLAQRAQGPALAEADTELAKVALDAGDAPKSRSYLETAISADQGYAPAYFYYGKALVGDKAQRPRARALFQQYLKLSPDGPLAAEAKKLSK